MIAPVNKHESCLWFGGKGLALGGRHRVWLSESHDDGGRYELAVDQSPWRNYKNEASHGAVVNPRRGEKINKKGTNTQKAVMHLWGKHYKP